MATTRKTRRASTSKRTGSETSAKARATRSKGARRKTAQSASKSVVLKLTPRQRKEITRALGLSASLQKVPETITIVRVNHRSLGLTSTEAASIPLLAVDA